MAEHTVPAWQKVTSIPGMLIFGTSTVVIQKVIFNMNAVGLSGNVETFSKPWFQTLAMFWGMMLCLIVYEIKSLIEHIAAKKKMVNTQYASMIGNGDSNGVINPVVPKEGVTHWQQYLYVLAPAMCDLAATCLMNIGLVWLPASIWQMLRGSMVIFSAILSVLFLRKKLQPFNWIGIGLVCIALVMVAMTSIFGDTLPEHTHHGTGPVHKSATPALMVVACVLVVVAQVIQASQIVIEEFLLKNVKCHPFLIVGLEGFWGTLVLTLLLIPIYFVPVPSNDPDICNDICKNIGCQVRCKFHEDTLDTLNMLSHSSGLAGTVVLYVFAILGYNLFGMLVTNTYTAVHRTILEAVRTACIWVTNLFIQYVVDPSFGERWCAWSFMEVAGFCLLLVGMFVYNKIILLPPRFYIDTDTSKDQPLLDDALSVDNPISSDVKYKAPSYQEQ